MKIITITGSMKFIDEMMEIAVDLELKGNCILMPVFCNSRGKEGFTDEEKKILSEGHYEKIKISDAILVCNINNYIGKQTKNEIEFAKMLNKEIIYYTDLIDKK